VPNESKLTVYGLYKQATGGDVSTPRPGELLFHSCCSNARRWLCSVLAPVVGGGLLLQRAKNSRGSKEAAISAALSEEELAFPNFLPSAPSSVFSPNLLRRHLYSTRTARACLSHPQAAF
jgi:hypothetical protein